VAERLVHVGGDLPSGEGQLRLRPDSVEDAVVLMDTYDVPADYFAVYEVVEEGDEGHLPTGTKIKDWDRLSASTRDRYLKSKRLRSLAQDFYRGRGKRDDKIRRWYEHGGDMRAARGHQRAGDYGRFRMEIKAEPIRGRRTGRLELWIDRGKQRKQKRG
jgi:hypothetical protein